MPLPTVEKIWHSVLHYLSNPWAALILLYLLHRVLRWAWPLLASPLVGRWEGWKARREEAEEATLHRKDPEARQAGPSIKCLQSYIHEVHIARSGVLPAHFSLHVRPCEAKSPKQLD